MNARELRIGNWIIGKIETGIPHRVTGEDIAYGDKYGVDFYELPLTEEWLIKAGFVKSTNWFRNGRHAVCLEDGLYEYSNIPIRTIGYVHTLQNVVFALTGKELDI